MFKKIYKNQHEKNKEIENYITNSVTESRPFLLEEEKAFLGSYTGSGGLAKQGATGGGLLNEYYTPETVVQLCWTLAEKYIKPASYPIRVLEPSSGIGDFFKPVQNHSALECHGIEKNEVSSKISKLLYRV